MHVYGNGTWTGGYLDETPAADRPRVEIHRQVALVPAGGQFFVRQPQLAMLVSYVRLLGPRRVVRKVRSRRSEAGRNDAWLSVGIGRLGAPGRGDPVLFVLTSGPRGVERAVAPADLVFPAPPGALDRIAPGYFEPAPGAAPWSGVALPLVAELEPLAGWHPEEGTRAEVSAAARDELWRLVESPPTATFVPLPPPPPPSPTCERREPAGQPSPQDRPGFTCFGYGQYAKTQVIPNLGRHLHLVAVHEINPIQIGPVPAAPGPIWDTSAHPRPAERIDNAVVAGYHHTHAPTAVELLERGARHVVIEKPIATSTEQLDALVGALTDHPDARVHVAFQRRHSPFNRLLVADLDGPPISLAATVYEVPLPARHWYRWPVVGNAVVSNGCHWIDHFLFLNDFVPVTRLDATRLASQTVLGIELENGASCSISLRHEGAPRRGVRDLCVFWNGDASVVVEDMRRYVAERAYRQVRRRTTHPYRSLEAMYGDFGRRIASDLPGDDIRSLRASAGTTLELARRVDSSR